MIAYHGSIHTNLTELRIFAKNGATLADPKVYMTTDKTHAALYIWDKPYYWFTYGFDESGKLEYQEYFKDALKYFYQGKRGSIYTCEGDFENSESAGIRNLVTSKTAVPVKSQKIIEDAFEYILNAESESKIKITRFEELTEKRILAIKKQVEEIKNDTKVSKEMLEFLNCFF